jgi:Protein of unknown function (DUF2510)
MDATGHAPGWFPDPLGRFDYRYWDGAQWSEHVSRDGQTYVDPLKHAPPATQGEMAIPTADVITASEETVASKPGLLARRRVARQETRQGQGAFETRDARGRR